MAVITEPWVDGSAPGGGDGTRERPFRSLEEGLRGGTTVHLRSGLYRGPFVLPFGSRLIGEGAVVLFAEGETTVLTAVDATLEGLSVQGGFVGIRASGPLVLRRVHFSGHRRVALSTSSWLEVLDSVFDGTVSETIGVQLLPGADARLSRVKFTGAFRRAVDAEGAGLHAEALDSSGPVQALHLARSTSEVRNLTAAGGSGAAVIVAEGELSLSDATVLGHEFGLEARRAALRVERFSSRGAQLAAISAVQCRGTLSGVTAEQLGSYGGLQLLDSALILQGVHLKGGRGPGVLVRHGTVHVTDLTVEQLQGEADADGLQVRDAEVTIKGLSLKDLAGAGVVVSAGGRVKLEQVLCERCRIAAVIVEQESKVEIRGLLSRGGEGPSLAVPEAGTVLLEEANLTGTEAPIWADCAKGAKVKVGRLTSNLPQPPSGCVELSR